MLHCLYLELSNPIYPEAMIQRQKNLHTQYHPLVTCYAPRLCTVCFPAMHCTRYLDSIVSEKTNANGFYAGNVTVLETQTLSCYKVT